ncbi:hypothetical protein ACEWY4_001946 [Coilia grayii]|uniref:CARD domain-containing protein n=1 Tax=Coilia grayii TaxID=363190 RepID=A0ABD1KUD7_9TELE
MSVTMTAQERIRRHKPTLLTYLSNDHTFVLQRVDAREIIDRRFYKELMQERSELAIIHLLDYLIDSGSSESAETFLNLLKEKEIQNTYPGLKEITDNQGLENCTIGKLEEFVSDPKKAEELVDELKNKVKDGEMEKIENKLRKVKGMKKTFTLCFHAADIVDIKKNKELKDYLKPGKEKIFPSIAFKHLFETSDKKQKGETDESKGLEPSQCENSGNPGQILTENTASLVLDCHDLQAETSIKHLGCTNKTLSDQKHDAQTTKCGPMEVCINNSRHQPQSHQCTVSENLGEQCVGMQSIKDKRNVYETNEKDPLAVSGYGPSIGMDNSHKRGRDSLEEMKGMNDALSTLKTNHWSSEHQKSACGTPSTIPKQTCAEMSVHEKAELAPQFEERQNVGNLTNEFNPDTENQQVMTEPLSLEQNQGHDLEKNMDDSGKNNSYVNSDVSDCGVSENMNVPSVTDKLDMLYSTKYHSLIQQVGVETMENDLFKTSEHKFQNDQNNILAELTQPMDVQNSLSISRNSDSELGDKDALADSGYEVSRAIIDDSLIIERDSLEGKKEKSEDVSLLKRDSFSSDYEQAVSVTPSKIPKQTCTQMSVHENTGLAPQCDEIQNVENLATKSNPDTESHQVMAEPLSLQQSQGNNLEKNMDDSAKNNSYVNSDVSDCGVSENMNIESVTDNLDMLYSTKKHSLIQQVGAETNAIENIEVNNLVSSQPSAAPEPKAQDTSVDSASSTNSVASIHTLTTHSHSGPSDVTLGTVPNSVARSSSHMENKLLKTSEDWFQNDQDNILAEPAPQPIDVQSSFSNRRKSDSEIGDKDPLADSGFEVSSAIGGSLIIGRDSFGGKKEKSEDVSLLKRDSFSSDYQQPVSGTPPKMPKQICTQMSVHEPTPQPIDVPDSLSSSRTIECERVDLIEGSTASNTDENNQTEESQTKSYPLLQNSEEDDHNSSVDLGKTIKRDCLDQTMHSSDPDSKSTSAGSTKQDLKDGKDKQKPKTRRKQNRSENELRSERLYEWAKGQKYTLQELQNWIKIINKMEHKTIPCLVADHCITFEPPTGDRQVIFLADEKMLTKKGKLTSDCEVKVQYKMGILGINETIVFLPDNRSMPVQADGHTFEEIVELCRGFVFKVLAPLIVVFKKIQKEELVSKF